MTMSPFPDPDHDGRRPSAGSDARGDLTLALEVIEALREDSRLVGAQISVDVKNAVVILDGLVLTSEIRARVSEDVWSVEGVRDVCNALQIPPWR